MKTGRDTGAPATRPRLASLLCCALVLGCLSLPGCAATRLARGGDATPPSYEQGVTDGREAADAEWVSFWPGFGLAMGFFLGYPGALMAASASAVATPDCPANAMPEPSPAGMTAADSAYARGFCDGYVPRMRRSRAVATAVLGFGTALLVDAVRFDGWIFPLGVIEWP